MGLWVSSGLISIWKIKYLGVFYINFRNIFIGKISKLVVSFH